ncbi:hypothetical protein JZ751_007547 [Albula glossodonta]|uniref:Alpha-galactosidase n=1 Tax=Albula glossodonta TaxID=121402 RepID=A0A8T2MXL5_9TELE|nr:hypothetical protein JZ751_007547 [Albula glossodonta]
MICGEYLPPGADQFHVTISVESHDSQKPTGRREMYPSLVVFVLAFSPATLALDNGLMRTPPMGWLAWERFRCDIDCKNDPSNCIRYGGRVGTGGTGLSLCERLFRDMADRLAEDGWRELGYVYVNIDDCWSSMERDKEGRLQPDPDRFPGGIPRLAQYIHNRGLKLGIYGDLGTHTCGGYPGTTLDKVAVDAQTFADWGVDMLKLDGCYSNVTEQAKGEEEEEMEKEGGRERTDEEGNDCCGTDGEKERVREGRDEEGPRMTKERRRKRDERGYPLMSKALNATQRPIAYSCSWPAYQGGLPPDVNYTQLGEICNLWRNYDDIQDSWDSVLSIVDWFSDNQDVLQAAAGPGRWNDPDMVRQSLSLLEQSRSQMALWAIMAAPLFMSNDLRTLSSEARAILQNKVLIGINQDPLGVQGVRLLKEKSRIEVFWRPLVDSASALVFFSRRTDMPYRYRTSLLNLGYPSGSYKSSVVVKDQRETERELEERAVYDVFTEKTLPVLKHDTYFTVSINPTGVVTWLLTPTMHWGQAQETMTYNFVEEAVDSTFL